MRHVGIRGSAAAITTVLVLGCGITSPTSAQQPAVVAEPELAAKGVWNATTTYAREDIVTARGSAWIAKRANKNKVPGQTSPSTAADWQLFARGFNALGAWSNATKYQPDDLVTHNGQSWRAKITNLNKQPAANANWELLAAKGAQGIQGIQGIQGPPGPNTDIGGGSKATPAISFTGDADTGIYSPATDKIAMVEAGVLFLHNMGTQNTALGFSSLNSNISGLGNTALGHEALAGVTSGSLNTGLGVNALKTNGQGNNNTAVGSDALAVNFGGHNNTAVGSDALALTNGGHDNTAVGFDALALNSSGDNNVALGSLALGSNTTASRNIAIGVSALTSNQTGEDNIAVGHEALKSAVASPTGHNTAIGASALSSNTTGTGNTAVGRGALNAMTSGDRNIAIGSSAGIVPTGPTDSIFIGNAGQTTDDLTIRIGTPGVQTSAFMAGIAGFSPGDAVAVHISAIGKLGTAVSSRRYKFDIETMADMSAMLSKLRPVTFRYKQAQDDGQHPLQYGLIAEEVAEVFPDLAVFKDGQPETVKYHWLPSFLLAGYQSQQHTIAAQAQKIETQAADIADLKERLRRLEALLPQLRAAARQ